MPQRLLLGTERPMEGSTTKCLFLDPDGELHTLLMVSSRAEPVIIGQRARLEAFFREFGCELVSAQRIYHRSHELERAPAPRHSAPRPERHSAGRPVLRLIQGGLAAMLALCIGLPDGPGTAFVPWMSDDEDRPHAAAPA